MTTTLPRAQLLHVGKSEATPQAPLKKILLNTPTLQVVQLQLAAGKQIPPHSAAGEITVQPLAGHVRFHVGGETHELVPGTLLYVAAGRTHSLDAVEDSLVLVTKRLP